MLIVKNTGLNPESQGSVNRIQEFISVMYPNLKVQNLAAYNKNHLLFLSVVRVAGLTWANNLPVGLRAGGWAQLE